MVDVYVVCVCSTRVVKGVYMLIFCGHYVCCFLFILYHKRPVVIFYFIWSLFCVHIISQSVTKEACEIGSVEDLEHLLVCMRIPFSRHLHMDRLHFMLHVKEPSSCTLPDG